MEIRNGLKGLGHFLESFADAKAFWLGIVSAGRVFIYAYIESNRHNRHASTRHHCVESRIVHGFLIQLSVTPLPHLGRPNHPHQMRAQRLLDPKMNRKTLLKLLPFLKSAVIEAQMNLKR